MGRQVFKQKVKDKTHSECSRPSADGEAFNTGLCCSYYLEQYT